MNNANITYYKNKAIIFANGAYLANLGGIIKRDETIDAMKLHIDAWIDYVVKTLNSEQA